MKRAHGEEAIALAKKHRMKYVLSYADHEAGKLSGYEEARIPIPAAETIARVTPWMVYVDYEEPRRCWWKPWTWLRTPQEESPDAADPTR